MNVPEVIVQRDEPLLAKAVAARLVTRLVDCVAARGTASVVLTGGGIGTAVLAELGAAPARDAIDWRHLDIWWGDERFVPVGDPERNETGARSALLDHVDVDPARVYPMPGSDGPDGDDPEAAAARYASWLKAATNSKRRGVFSEALDTKYFSSPVRSFTTQINQYAFALGWPSTLNHTRAALAFHSCSPSVCRDNRKLCQA